MTLADKFADSKTVFANVLELLFCARCLQNMEATMFKSLQFFIFFEIFQLCGGCDGRRWGGDLGGGGQIVTLTGSVKEEGAARALKLLKM